MARASVSSPARQQALEDDPLFRLIRVPPARDKFFPPLKGHFHWDHFPYFRLLVLAMAVMWGRRTGANLSRWLDAERHRTRFNHVFRVERWDPEAALRQQAQALLRALRPGQGEPIDLIIDDSKQATRGTAMDAIAARKAPTAEAYIRGHHDVWAMLGYRDHVLPFGLRLYVKKAPCPTVGVPVQTTTELAAPLIREGTPPAGVKGMVLFEADYRCPTVVKAGREPPVPFASTLRSNRRLFKQGWKLHAGR
jgi:hypothetical protein